MSATHVQNLVLDTPEGRIANYPVTSTGSGGSFADDSITTGTTDQLVSAAFTRAQLKSFYFVSDQAITLETNATDHSGGDSIAIQANVPLVWQSGGYYTIPFTADVTKFYLTNSSGVTANYTLRYLIDATP